MNDPRDIVIRPVISEKSYDMIELNRYTFEVAKTASKPQIADAITEIFGVTVTKVNTMNVNGKPRRVRVAKGKTGRKPS
jgi:large subunit ribosomal protein L23